MEPARGGGGFGGGGRGGGRDYGRRDYGCVLLLQRLRQRNMSNPRVSKLSDPFLWRAVEAAAAVVTVTAGAPFLFSRVPLACFYAILATSL